MNMLQPENPISTTVSRARKPRPLHVPALKSSTKDGKPYTRAVQNQAQITEMLAHPPSGWLEKVPDLQNETLVFLIRRTHGSNDFVCGKLMQELQERIKACAGRYTQSLDEVDEETVLLNMEMRILERVIPKTNTASRKQEFLDRVRTGSQESNARGNQRTMRAVRLSAPLSTSSTTVPARWSVSLILMPRMFAISY